MAKAYYIPNGTKNLQAMFPSLDFTQIAEYYLEILEGDTVMATTTKTLVCGCEDDPDMTRIHFLNYLGTIDAINFKLVEKVHEAKSERFQQPSTYPLDKEQHSIGRFNVSSNDTYKAVTIDWQEENMDWIDELFDSPVAWLERTGTQSQPDIFLPIVISDLTRQKVKREGRYIYEIEIEFTLSHEPFTIRN